MSDKPIVSTYIHVPPEAPVSFAVDSSSFGVSASIRVGSYGENDAALFFRNVSQLHALARVATQAAKGMEDAIALRVALAAASKPEESE